MQSERYTHFKGTIYFGILLLFLFFTGTSEAFDGALVAPKDTIFCSYFGLGESLKYLLEADNSEPPTLSAPIQEVFRQTLTEFHALKTTTRQKAEEKETPSSLPKLFNDDYIRLFLQTLREFCRTKKFYPERLYFFLKNDGEYVLCLTGDITPNLLRLCFSPECILPRNDGFSVVGPKNRETIPSMILHIGQGYIFLCPSDFEGNVMDSIQANQNEPLASWPTFKGMIKENPLAAVEMDVETTTILAQKLGLEVPFPFSSIKVLRVLLSKTTAKIQFFTPADDAREILIQMVKYSMDVLKKDINGKAFEKFRQTMRLFPSGKSIFVTAEGLQETTSLAGISGLSVLSYFAMVNLEKAQSIAH